MVIHVAKRTKINPNDHIRLRFGSKSFDKKNGNVNFRLKMATMIKETGGIFSMMEDQDFVEINHRINDFDYAMENDERQFDAILRDWNDQHLKAGGNFNRPDHPGPAPVFKNPSELSTLEKVIDNSNSTYQIQTLNGDLKPIRRGIVRWNENIQSNNYVDVLFLASAKFADQENWIDRMLTIFEEWQKQRQNIELNLDFDMDKDTTLEIIEPTTTCTIRMNIPVSELEDGGNPIKLYNQVIKILKYHNNIEKKKNGNEIFPLSNIKTISRSKKSKSHIDKVLSRWENWKFNNQKRYEKMNVQTKQIIQEKRVLEQIVTGNIYIEFDKWLDHIPKYIDYALGVWKVDLVTTPLSDLEKRCRAIGQCQTCGDITCEYNRCRKYNQLVDQLADQYNVKKEKAKRWIGRFCTNCGQIGGHRGKCHTHCRFC